MKYLLFILLFVVSCKTQYKFIGVTYSPSTCVTEKAGMYVIYGTNPQIGYQTTVFGIAACGLKESTLVCSEDGLTFKVCEYDH